MRWLSDENQNREQLKWENLNTKIFGWLAVIFFERATNLTFRLSWLNGVMLTTPRGDGHARKSWREDWVCNWEMGENVAKLKNSIEQFDSFLPEMFIFLWSTNFKLFITRPFNNPTCFSDQKLFKSMRSIILRTWENKAIRTETSLHCSSQVSRDKQNLFLGKTTER